MTSMQIKKRRITVKFIYSLLNSKPQSIRDLTKKTNVSYSHHMVRSRLMRLTKSGAAQRSNSIKNRPAYYIRTPDLKL